MKKMSKYDFKKYNVKREIQNMKFKHKISSKNN